MTNIKNIEEYIKTLENELIELEENKNILDEDIKRIKYLIQESKAVRDGRYKQGKRIKL